MTVHLSASSPRRAAAARFGAELRRALDTREVGTRRFAEQTGLGRTALVNYLGGYNLPRYDTAIAIATALEWPALARIARAARESRCALRSCSQAFLNEGGTPQRYCRPECGKIAAKLQSVRREREGSPGTVLLDAVRSALASDGPLERSVLEAAVAEHAAVAAKQRKGIVGLERRLGTLSTTVELYCRGCEPEGICRTEDCPLRAFSPLPFAASRRKVDVVTPAPGRWSTPEEKEAHIRLLELRWADPEERRRQAERMTEFWATLTNADRVRLGAAISEGRRSHATKGRAVRRRTRAGASKPVTEQAQSRGADVRRLEAIAEIALRLLALHDAGAPTDEAWFDLRRVLSVLASPRPIAVGQPRPDHRAA